MNLKARGNVDSEASLKPDTLWVDVDGPLGVVVAHVLGRELLTRKQEASTVVRQL